MAIGGKVFQRVGAGGPCACLGLLGADNVGKSHLVEQDFADLFRAAEIEGPAGEFLRFVFKPGHALREFAGEARQAFAIDQHAFALHVGDDADQRAVHGFVDGGDALARQARLQPFPQAEGHVGVFGGIARGFIERRLVECDLRLTRADQLLDRDRRVAEMQLGQLVHAVIVLAGFEHEGEQHRVVDRADGDAVAREDRDVVLDVLPDLEDGRVFEHRLQQLDRCPHVDLRGRLAGEQVGVLRAVRQRNVAGEAGGERQRDADEARRPSDRGRRFRCRRRRSPDAWLQ